MPQLDILIFKYENINFIISFFLLFFLNQYYIFPMLLRNIILRRRLISRKVDSVDSVFFSINILKTFHISGLDNEVFKLKVDHLRNFVFGFIFDINIFIRFFKSIKIMNYSYFFGLILNKVFIVLWNFNNG